MLLRTVLALSLVGCAAEHEPATDSVTSFAGATCLNGMYEDGELCVGRETLVLATPGELVRTVLAVDVDADGHRDIVALTESRVWIRYAQPSGGFAAATWFYTTAGADYRDVAAGDFDGDGDLDLALADASADRIVVWRNNAGAFNLQQVVATGDEPIRVLAAHLDADARHDLAVLATGADEIDIIRATGAPFSFAIPYAAGDARDIALGDCDLDGRRDLLYVNGTGAGTVIRARRNFDAFANFNAPITTAMPLFHPMFGFLTPYVVAAGDFDNDGPADLAVSTSFSRMAPATSNGNCTFTPGPLGVTWAYVVTRLRTIDWDGDGALDLAAPHGQPGGGAGDEVFSIAFGDGAGAFPFYQAEARPPEVVIPRDLAFTDANLDGHEDVLVGGIGGVYLERRTH